VSAQYSTKATMSRYLPPFWTSNVPSIDEASVQNSNIKAGPSFLGTFELLHESHTGSVIAHVKFENMYFVLASSTSAVFDCARLREVMATLAPSITKCIVAASPRPAVAPVMRMVCPSKDPAGGRGSGQTLSRNRRNRRGIMVCARQFSQARER
jgi:hypothetical protein